MVKPLLGFIALCWLVLGTADAVQTLWQPVFDSHRFRQPIAMLQPPGGNAWYVIEKAGRIWRQQGNGFVLFADLSARIESGPGEAGMLGIAFHPRYGENHRLFLSYTVRSRPLRSVIAEYAVMAGHLQPGSERVLLQVEQPYSNHNSGQLAFGPDGYLYISLGDGGAGGDPHGHGQNTHTLLGSLLRIDVDHGRPYAIPPDNPFARRGGRPEIYAYGLRNPWGWGFDRQTGKLWLADVGQDRWEEVDIIQSGGNYGWNIREGRHCYARDPCELPGLLEPELEYSHRQGCSITGGRVYRGRAVPELQGHFIYADYCSGRVWAYGIDGRAPPRLIAELDINPSSFAEDRQGELYLTDLEGGIYRLSGVR
jgi:glucose/arabinose dehydrogenase